MYITKSGKNGRLHFRERLREWRRLRPANNNIETCVLHKARGPRLRAIVMMMMMMMMMMMVMMMIMM